MLNWNNDLPLAAEGVLEPGEPSHCTNAVAMQQMAE